MTESAATANSTIERHVKSCTLPYVWFSKQAFSVPKNWASNPVWGRGRGTKQGGNFTGNFIRPDIFVVANLWLILCPMDKLPFYHDIWLDQ